MFLVFRLFLQMRPYFPTEVEGKGVSSKLMVMVGVYMCYKVLICRIQVIKQTYVTCLFQNDRKNHIFSPRKIPHFPYFFKMLSGQPAIKKSMLHAIIRYMQKKIEAPSPKIQCSICSRSPLKSGGGGGGGGGGGVETMQTLH